MRFSFAACAAGMMLLANAHAEEAASGDIVTVAERYLEAYSTYDVDKMAPYMADEMVFMDPTSTNQNADGEPFIFEGKEAVLKGLGDYAAQYKAFSVYYDVERRYESNAVVVFVAQLTYNLVANDDETYSGGAPIVTAVTVENGKVVRHVDLYDYAGNVVNFTD